MLQPIEHGVVLYLFTVLLFQPAELELRVRPYLEGWSKDVMEYVCRCVDIMSQDLQYLIYAVRSTYFMMRFFDRCL